ncbi:MAG: acyltransferase domain-containing protein, partial [Gemmatimonadaceae bacterium]
MTGFTGAAPIAIIGIGCRFPGGINDPKTFWDVVANGVDAITEIPRERFDVNALYDPTPGKRGRISTRWGGFIQQRLEEFDASFFGISRTYAERLDPQHRLVLETAWESLEDAGLDVGALAGSRTAVYVGQWVNDFEHRVFADPRSIDFQKAMGSGRYAAAGRVSFAFGFRGPTLSIDAACSSGLAAVHLAVQSLRSGESTLALAGGVNVILEPHIHVAYSDSQMLSPDGRCRFGDASGAGYVRSEGAGMVTLKRLDHAIADGDRVYAVIRGSAVNSDGDSSGSFGRPSRVGQEELIRRALSDGGVHPSQVSYVEAHGTGTRVGDPVEIDALANVLADGRPDDAPPTWVGSVKTNLGHTEAAAGVAGLIKTALMLQHAEIAPSLHFETPNPAIAWDSIPIAIPIALSHWQAREGARIAGVSSYGIGGTNAHVVLQEGPHTEASSSGDLSNALAQLLVVSAHSHDALQARVASTAAWLNSVTGALTPLRVVARTLALRRSQLSHRVGVVATSVTDATEALRTVAAETDSRPLVNRRIGFVFPGQGSQWAGMARDLLATEPVFAAAIDACATAMRAHVAWSLRDVLSADTLSEDIDVIQPAIFAMQVALVALWRSWGVVPSGVAGHSMGEVAAAHTAGALSLEDAAQIICVRSRLMRRVRGTGGMVAVELSAHDAATAIAPFGDRLSMAAENSPRSSLVAGDRDALVALVANLTAHGVFAKLVRVDVASHSPQVDPLLPELVDALRAITPVGNAVPLYSTVRGVVVDGGSLRAEYWSDNLRRTVRLLDATTAMANDGIDIFIEVSPHAVLSTALNETLDTCDDPILVLPSMRRDVDGRTSMLQSLGALYAAGVNPAWQHAFESGVARAELPTYPFQRERFWYEDEQAVARGAPRATGAHEFLGARMTSAADAERSEWEVFLDSTMAPWIADHVVRGSPVVPAAAIVQVMLGAARELFGPSATTVELRKLTFTEAIPFGEAARMSLRLTAARVAPDAAVFQVRLREGEGDSAWRIVATARAHDMGEMQAAFSANFATVIAESPMDAGVQHYASMQTRRLDYGAAFRVVGDVHVQGPRAEATLRATDLAGAANDIVTLDGALQLLLELVPPAVAAVDETLVPVAIERLRTRSSTWPDTNTARARLVDTAAAEFRGAVQLADGSGQVVCEVEGVDFSVIRQVASEELRSFRYAAGWEVVTLAELRTRTAQQWLVVGDNADFANLVTAALRTAGERVLTWTSAEVLRAESLPGDVTALLVLSALQVEGSGDAAGSTLAESALRQAYDTSLRALQLAEASHNLLTRTVLVTCGAVAVQSGAEVVAPTQSPLWGLGRVAQRESITPNIQLVDLDGTMRTD